MKIRKISIMTLLVILCTTTVCGCTTLDEYDANMQQEIDKRLEIQSLKLDISKIKSIVNELKNTSISELQLLHIPRLEEEVDSLLDYYKRFKDESKSTLTESVYQRIYDTLKELEILIHDIKDNNIINLDEKLKWIEQSINMCYDLVKKDV